MKRKRKTEQGKISLLEEKVINSILTLTRLMLADSATKIRNKDTKQRPMMAFKTPILRRMYVFQAVKKTVVPGSWVLRNVSVNEINNTAQMLRKWPIYNAIVMAFGHEGLNWREQ